jgi:hypothetical protein
MGLPIFFAPHVLNLQSKREAVSLQDRWKHNP